MSSILQKLHVELVIIIQLTYNLRRTFDDGNCALDSLQLQSTSQVTHETSLFASSLSVRIVIKPLYYFPSAFIANYLAPFVMLYEPTRKASTILIYLRAADTWWRFLFVSIEKSRKIFYAQADKSWIEVNSLNHMNHQIFSSSKVESLKFQLLIEVSDGTEAALIVFHFWFEKHLHFCELVDFWEKKI